MTQKHFEAIALLIRIRIERGEGGWHYVMRRKIIGLVAHDLADYFATTNANFKRDKFLAACGL